MGNNKSKILIIGKLPPPYIGPAIATDILLKSKLNQYFQLAHFDSRINKEVADLGSFGLKKAIVSFLSHMKFLKKIIILRPDLTLVPISQTTLGFVKDSFYILMASIFSNKTIIQLRGSDFKNWLNRTKPMTRGYVRFCLSRTEGVIVLGNNLKYLFKEYYKEENIFVVPNGCDTPMTNSDKKEGKEVKLLYFSNLLESKGIKEVLQGLELLKRKGLNSFTLDAVGAWNDENFKKECEDMVLESQLPVKFHNSCSGELKWNFFRNSDVFVFTPNKPEGHPWSIVEAMSASLPIVTTNQGAIVESVIDHKNGFVVEVNSPSQIAEKLALLINNETLRTAMAGESRKLYLDKFTEDQMVKNLKQVFDRTIIS